MASTSTTTIKGVLFDKDGTLIDFTATWRGLFENMLDDYAGADQELRIALGRAVGFDVATRSFLPGSPVVADTSDVIARLMADLLPGVDASTIEDDANRRAAATGAGDIAPVDGLADALDRLKAGGARLGVGTHDSAQAAHAHIKALGVADRFDFVAGYDSGWGLKPGPGMPEAFASHIGANTSEVVMVGDSIHDLEAGLSAKCALVVGVLTGPATERDLAPLADIVLPSVADLPDYLAHRLNPT
ncbi:MAG: HAD family hydrolase [Pikeienuella sp.]